MFNLTLKNLEDMMEAYYAHSVFWDRRSISEYLHSLWKTPALPDDIAILFHRIALMQIDKRQLLNYDDWIYLFRACASIEALATNPATKSGRAEVAIRLPVINSMGRSVYAIACALAKFNRLSSSWLKKLSAAERSNEYHIQYNIQLLGQLLTKIDGKDCNSANLSYEYLSWALAVVDPVSRMSISSIDYDLILRLSAEVFNNPIPPLWLGSILNADYPLLWTRHYFELKTRLPSLPADFVESLAQSPRPLHCAAAYFHLLDRKAYFHLLDRDLLTPALTKWLPTCVNPFDAIHALLALDNASIHFDLDKLGQLQEPIAFALDLIALNQQHCLTNENKINHYELALKGFTGHFVLMLAQNEILTRATYEIGLHFEFRSVVAATLVSLSKVAGLSDNELAQLKTRSFAWVENLYGTLQTTPPQQLTPEFSRLLVQAENPREFLECFDQANERHIVEVMLKATSPVRYLNTVNHFLRLLGDEHEMIPNLHILPRPDDFVCTILLLKQAGLLNRERRDALFVYAKLNVSFAPLQALYQTDLLNDATFRFYLHFGCDDAAVRIILAIGEKNLLDKSLLSNLATHSLEWLIELTQAIVHFRTTMPLTKEALDILVSAAHPTNKVASTTALIKEKLLTKPGVVCIAQLADEGSLAKFTKHMIKLNRQGDLSPVILSAYRQHLQQKTQTFSVDNKEASLKLG